MSRERDAGFTLIELIVTVAILGTISAALFGVVIQYLKTTSDTRARLSESTDQQFISTYWQNDVSSLGRRTFDETTGSLTPKQSVFVGGAGPEGCGNSFEHVVVAFAWDDFPVSDVPTDLPTNVWQESHDEVAYVTVSNGSNSALALQRVRCNAGVAERPVTVAHNLVAPPKVACDGDNYDDPSPCEVATLPNRVSMKFTVRDADNPGSVGYTTAVSADRRQSP